MTKEHYHAGEIQLQTQVGAREQIEVMTQRLMHDYLIDQHREFFEGLEYIFLGNAAQDGRPYASLVTGPPGFVTSPDPKRLAITSRQINKMPSLNNLRIDDAVGVLGIDLSKRRRNRMHGLVSSVTTNAIEITVTQSYGNCPKYINRRAITERLDAVEFPQSKENQTLSDEDLKLIGSSDTCFIASYVSDGTGAPYEGADINHRGGQVGFVRVEGASSLIIPDYKGNNLFNTFGNLILNPEAAVLFIDFESGDQLHIIGQASLIEGSSDLGSFPGALRLLRIDIETVDRRTAATPLRWRFVDNSPFNP